MSQKIDVTVISDVSGVEGAHSAEFAWNGTTYTIDLTEDEHKAMEAALHLDKATRVAGRRGRPKGTAKAATSAPAASTTGPGLTKEERTEVREYAKANGHELAKRGRLPELAVLAWRQKSPEILAKLAVAS